jgi:hypothetical protein
MLRRLPRLRLLRMRRRLRLLHLLDGLLSGPRPPLLVE